MLAMSLVTLTAASQDERNHRPEITGQREIRTHEDQAVEIKLTDLYVRDYQHWWYPIGFSLELFDGKNYTLVNNTVIPDDNFYGVLTVPVTVNDGEEDSKKFDLRVEVVPVNDPPVITGQQSMTADAGQPITITPDYLSVADPDNEYPDDFQIIIPSSTESSYTASGNTVTPSDDFEGQLTVRLLVNDGRDSSPYYNFLITVLPRNKPPVIVDQRSVTIDEDGRFTMEFSHLVVTDPDSDYPADFQLKILPGSSYSSAENEIRPTTDFSGNVTVNVVVNDGYRDSNTYPFRITVTSVNDPPILSDMDDEVIDYKPGNGPVRLAEMLTISDVDDDSLTGAEVSLQPDRYLPGGDDLRFQVQSPNIAGSFDVTRGVLKLDGKAPLADYAAVLRTVEYNFAGGPGLPFENKIISFTATDGRSTSEKAQRIIGGPDVVVDLDIPTAFTPNGDSSNDTWRIKPLESSEEIARAVVRVYNRSGYLLFEAVGFENEWDGKVNGAVLPADTYFYTIDFNLEYFKRSFRGVVAILR